MIEGGGRDMGAFYSMEFLFWANLLTGACEQIRREVNWGFNGCLGQTSNSGAVRAGDFFILSNS